MLKVVRGIGFWTLLAFFAGSPAWAQTDAQTAEQLLRSSGVWEQLKSVAQHVRAGMHDAAKRGNIELSAAVPTRCCRRVRRDWARCRRHAANSCSRS